MRGSSPWTYQVEAPVCRTAERRTGTNGFGPGVALRCASFDGGMTVGERRQVAVTVTRLSGPAAPVRHDLRWRVPGRDVRTVAGSVTLPLGRPTTVLLDVRAVDGVQSALLEVDAPGTIQRELLVPVVVTAGTPVERGAWAVEGTVRPGELVVHTIEVPHGISVARVWLDGIAESSQVRFRLFHPAGYPLDFGFGSCFINYVPPTGPDPRCEGPERFLADPTPGLWHVVVEARRTSPVASNSYRVQLEQLSLETDRVEIDDPGPDGTAAFSWTVRNPGSELTTFVAAQALGAAREQRITLRDGETWSDRVDIPTLGSAEWPSTGLHVSTTQVSNPRADFVVTLLDADGAEVQPWAQEWASPFLPYEGLAAGRYTLQVTAVLPDDVERVDLTVRDVLRSWDDFGRVVVDEAWTAPRTIEAGAVVEVPARVERGSLKPPPGRTLFSLGFLRLDETSHYGFPELVLRPSCCGRVAPDTPVPTPRPLG
jgi:hypothetical protein